MHKKFDAVVIENVGIDTSVYLHGGNLGHLTIDN